MTTDKSPVFVAYCNKMFPNLAKTGKSSKRSLENLVQLRRISIMALTDTQVYIALAVALIPGILAWRLATELYK
jgi:photosystem I subunit 12